MGKGRVLLDDCNYVASKVGGMQCKLIFNGGEDILELFPVKIIPGTEKAGTKDSLLGNHF